MSRICRILSVVAKVAADLTRLEETMRLRIQIPADAEDAASLHVYVERRLGFALSRFEDRLTRVLVRCTDLNGPKGGLDKRCVVELRGPEIDVLVVESRQSEWTVAIDEALGLAGRALVRALDRAGRRALRPFARTAG